MSKVGELKGIKSLRALNVFSTLSIGLKMTPDYAKLTFVDFFKLLQDLPEDEQRAKLTEAVMVVQLEPDEVTSILSFCSDSNGVPYSHENIKNLGPAQIVDLIVAVCLEVSKIKIDSVSEAEKKK